MYTAELTDSSMFLLRVLIRARALSACTQIKPDIYFHAYPSSPQKMQVGYLCVILSKINDVMLIRGMYMCIIMMENGAV